jgi:hypothetical protein
VSKQLFKNNIIFNFFHIGFYSERTERDRERQRETERDRERQRETERDRETEETEETEEKERQRYR